VGTLSPCGTLAPQLEKMSTLFNKMRHYWKNALRLQKCGTLGKMVNTWKNSVSLEKFGTFEKMRHNW